MSQWQKVYSDKRLPRLCCGRGPGAAKAGRGRGSRGKQQADDGSICCGLCWSGLAGLGETVLMHQNARCQIFEWVQSMPTQQG
ncbi:hypothetical protein LZ31DRAFT_556662 [Colletotrichum somersetense]|nr:hypothetical protein LZ31DRAFT_556662 [Colletotrichum somersetense]